MVTKIDFRVDKNSELIRNIKPHFPSLFFLKKDDPDKTSLEIILSKKAFAVYGKRFLRRYGKNSEKIHICIFSEFRSLFLSLTKFVSHA